MDMQSQLVMAMMCLFAVLMVAVVVARNDRVGLSKDHIFDVQCQIDGKIHHYQVEKLYQEGGAIRFKADGKKVICSQFFVQEISQSPIL